MDQAWSIAQLWNDLLVEDYPVKPRNYIRASDIGKPFLDRYLTMRGVAPTNPFPARIKRVFDCGFIFEQAVERIFRLAGIMIDSQETLYVKTPGMLDVSGHYDFKVGGKINVAAAKERLNDPDLPYWMKNRASKLLDNLVTRYPDGMKVLISEMKTVNSRSFWSPRMKGPETGFFNGYPHHKLQLMTYLLGTGLDEGRLFYVSKDDLTLMETSIFAGDQQLKDMWYDDVSKMTHFIKDNKEPAKESDIIFNQERGVWEANWKVGRSPYLTMITGYETVEQWLASLQKILKEKNQGVCASCKKSYTLATLEKYHGMCGRCAKKPMKKEVDPVIMDLPNDSGASYAVW